MSAKTTQNPAPLRQKERNLRPVLPISLTAALCATGLSLVLAAGSASDVTDFSDAMGVPIEISALPGIG